MDGERMMAEIIEKRRDRWYNGGKLRDGSMVARYDVQHDARLSAAAVDRIFEVPELLAMVRERPWLLIEICFTVVDKNGRTVPFFLNDCQRQFVAEIERDSHDRPFLLLKGRQLGFTTLITAIQLSCAIVWRNFSGATLAQDSASTEKIFNGKARDLLKRLPERLRPHEQYNSARQLTFDQLGSKWSCAPATDGAFRSQTLRFVHYSEAAFYQCSLAVMQAAIKPAIAEGAIEIYETTANGFGEFRDLWMSGACHNLFFAWWRADEYRRRDISIVSRFERSDDLWIRERIRFLRDEGLAEDQIAWYCDTYDQYMDKRLIRQEYPCTPEEAFVASGDCAFDLDALSAQLVRCERLEPRRGRFTYRVVCDQMRAPGADTGVYEWRMEEIGFSEEPDGPWWIYEEPRSQRESEGVVRRCPYVLGGDTAGEGSDYYAGQMVDATSGAQVATYHARHVDDDTYAEQMLAAALYYNSALIAIEINFSPRPMNVVVRKFRYRGVYLREKFTGIGGEPEQVPGFRTTAQTKPAIVAEGQSILRETPEVLSDVATVRELTTFIRVNGSQYEAAQGEHDDLAMAFLIAQHARGQAKTAWTREKVRREDALAETLARVARANGLRRQSNSNFAGWEDL